MSCVLSCLTAFSIGCGGGDDGPADSAPPAETLDPEPAGAPTAIANGRLSCLGNNAASPAEANAIELTGYVRTLADPAASAEPPAAQIEAFSPSGTSLGAAFADPSKDGRVSVSVPINDDGFTGYVVATESAYLDWSFQTNRAVTATEANGWTWLVTQAEVDQWATDYSVTLDGARGILVGAVHDCDSFGTGDVVIQVNGETDGVFYLADFAAAAGSTFTDASGRFIVPNVPAGSATVKAFGRLDAGGPLTLLSSLDLTVGAGRINAVALQPR